MKKLILFDLDGTLLDTIEDIMDSMNYALAKFKYPIHTKKEYISFLGQGASVLATRALGSNFKENELQDFLDTYLQHYSHNRLNKTHEFNGVTKTLDELRASGLSLGVISNKPHADVLPIVEHFFPGYFDYVFGQIPGIPKKPSPKIIDLIEEKSTIKRSEMLYIGDSITDYRFAINANLDYFIIKDGYEQPEKLQECICLSKFSDILLHIKNS